MGRADRVESGLAQAADETIVNGDSFSLDVEVFESVLEVRTSSEIQKWV